MLESCRGGSRTVETSLAAYTYLGGGSVVRIDYGQPQVRLDLWGGTSGTYAGIDRFGRVIDQKWSAFGGTVKDQFQYGYDRNSNRTSKDNTLTTSFDEIYAYDNLNRLTTFGRGELNAQKTAVTGAVLNQGWQLDAVGNWSEFYQDVNGVLSNEQFRTHNKANETTVVTDITAPDWTDPVHDRAGNMTTLPKPANPANGFTAAYDAWNRLVELKDGSSTVAKYRHDGRGRRIVKETYAGGTLSETRHFYHTNGWQVLEERVGASTTAERQYVWGARYVDELVCRDRDADANTGNGLEERLYALQDANFNVTALTDTSGAVVERYSYTPYGTRSIHDGSFGARGSSSYAWDVGHQGLSHDTESGLVYNRNRVLHPLLGRFMQRDPLGYVDGLSLYEYVRGSPVNHTDPSGLIAPAIGAAAAFAIALKATAAAMGMTMMGCLMDPTCRDAVNAATKKAVDGAVDACKGVVAAVLTRTLICYYTRPGGGTTSVEIECPITKSYWDCCGGSQNQPGEDWVPTRPPG